MGVFLVTGILGMSMILSIRLLTLFGIGITLIAVILRGSFKLITNAIDFIKDKVISIDNIAMFSWIAYIFYLFKTGFICFFGPIVSGDALYFWISMAKVFVNTNAIPIQDPYHLWTYSGEPLSSGLFAWGYFILGSTELEVFRGISFLFFIFIPLIVRLLAIEAGFSGQAPNISMAIIIFMPITDYMLYIYSFYPDSFAVVFIFITIILFRRAFRTGKRKIAFIGGLAWSLTILSKYPMGLLLAIYLLLEIIGMMGTTKNRRILAILLSIGTLGTMLYAANVIWSYLNFFSLCLVTAISIAILVLRFGIPCEKHYNITPKLLLAFLLGTGLALVWGIRDLLIGASLFGVDFLRLSQPSPEATETSTLLSQIYPPESITLRYNPITPIGFLIHPLVDGTFFVLSIVILIYLARHKRGNILFSMILFWYLGYITVLGYFLSGRHILPTAFILAPLLGIGIIEYSNSLLPKRRARVAKAMLVILFVLTSIIQMITVNMYLQIIGVNDNFELLLIPYTTNFSLFRVPDIVIRVVGLSIVFAIVFVIGISRRGCPLVYRLASMNRTKMICTSIIVSLVLPIPIVMSAYYTTKGNLFQYDYIGSWNRGDFELGRHLKDMVHSDEIILSYGDVVLSYMEFRIVDLYHLGLSYIAEVINETNITKIRNILLMKNIHYLVLPTNDSYLYESYARFVSFLSFTEDLTQIENVSLVMVFARWRVYCLI